MAPQDDAVLLVPPLRRAVHRTWEVVGDAAPEQREQTGEPRLWENVKALAAG